VIPEVAMVAAAAKRSSVSDVARRLSVNEKSVRKWLAGESEPREKARAIIRAALGARPSKPVEKGDTAPSLPLSRPPDEGAKGEVTDHDDPRANAVATLRYLRELLEDVPKERAHSIANAITACSRLLAKLTGQIDVSETMLLRSMGWARIKTALVEAVRPYPDATRALAEAIEKLSATA
jgi:transcriptional regulator with XRE-family HTH domain